MTDANEPTSPTLAPAVRAYLDNYVPKSLTATQWASSRPTVLRLVADTDPDTTTDAKQTLAALCGFLAWTAVTLGSVEPVDVVTEPNVERWFQSLSASKSEGTRSNLRARLRRVVRVLAGDDARTKRAPRPEGAAPYSAEELATLVDAAPASDALAAALALAVISGCVVPAARGARIPGTDETRAACGAWALPSEWLDRLPRGADRRFSDATWGEARQAAERAGVQLLASRLRTTWLVFVLNTTQPLTTVLSRWALSRADLERAQPFLPAVRSDAAAAALRG